MYFEDLYFQKYKNDDDFIPTWRGCHGDSVLVCSPFTVAAGGAGAQVENPT